MKNLILLFILIGLAFWSCNDETLLFENEIIEGTVFIENSSLGELKKNSSKTLVYLSLDSVGTTYLTKTETDSLGKFTFKYLPKTCDSIYLFAEKTIDDLTYKGNIKLNEKEIIIKPNYPGKYIMVDLKDKKNGLNEVEVFVFSNESQLKNIEKEEPSGYVQKMKTNTNGKVVFYNLPENEYYVVSKNNKVISNIEPVDLRQTTSKAITLSIIPINTLPKFTIKVLDGIGDLLSGIETYIFTSRFLQSNISSKIVSGQIATGLTNSKGECAFQDLPTNQNLYIAAKGYFIKNNKNDTTYTMIDIPVKLTKDTTINITLK